MFAKLVPLFALAWSCSTPANAAIYTRTIEGTVISGGFSDTEFSIAAGQSFAGLPFTEVFVIDDTKGAAYPNGGQYGESLVFGGTNYGTSDPISAFITINSLTETIPLQAVNFGEVFVWPTIGQTVLYGAIASSLTSGANHYYLSYQVNGNTTFLDSAFYGASIIGPIVTYPFQATSTFGSPGGSLDLGIFSIDGVRVTTEPAPPPMPTTPEPATWAMMLIGFAAIGAAVRNEANVPVPSI